MTARRVVIWGARGHCRVLADVLRAAGGEVAAVADRDELAPPLPGVPLLVGRAAFRDWLSAQAPDPLGFVVAVGGARGADRLEIAAWLAGLGLGEVQVRHGQAIVEPSARLGPGCQVLAGAVVGAGARLGRQVIVNTRASVDHDCQLGDGVHVAPGATICGDVTVGSGAFVAAGATVLPKLAIGDGATVGAGAVVTAEVAPGVTVLGAPARVRP